MTGPPDYEVAVVGGGPAGLTAAMYTARLGHRTALFDAGGGRHEAVARVHNLVGVSPETSGAELADLAVEQLIGYGVDYFEEPVTGVERRSADPPHFAVTAERADLAAERVVLATGFSDVEPGVPGLRAFTGRGLHYCVHCDAYTLGDRSVFVLGHDDHAAGVAMLLLNVTPDVDLLLNGDEPSWSDETGRQVVAHPVEIVERQVAGTVPASPDVDQWLRGLEFEDGSVRNYAGGFAVYGKTYDNDLARELGCDLEDDGAVVVDGDRRTSVDGVYAAGDLTHGQNQTTIALGDGAYAGIAVHRDLRTFPVPADELEEVPDAPAMADDLRARMRRVNERGMAVGMTPDGEVESFRERDAE